MERCLREFEVLFADVFPITMTRKQFASMVLRNDDAHRTFEHNRVKQ